MACALEWDDESDAHAAYRHYRKAVQLDPGQPLYSSAYALMRIRRRPDRSKYDREALRRLRDAFAVCPDDPDIVYNYAMGLIEMRRHGEAHIVLRRARKRWPDHPAFEGLWFDFLVDQGSLPRPNKPPGRSAKFPTSCGDRPTILKFPGAERQHSVAPALRPRARLKTALAKLGISELLDISRNLALSGSDDIDEIRNAIALSLQNPQRLRCLVARLSAGSRHLIQILTDAGGSRALKQLRVDAPSPVPEPHWSRKGVRPAALDELRQHGLVYLVGEDTSEVVMIPSDLRRLLRELLNKLK
jgi:tetratricopeptide (TPR) repeat protein